MIQGGSTTFSKFSKMMHWLLAAIIFFLIIIGIYMGDLPRVTDDEKLFVHQLYEIHNSIGVVVLLLVALRIGLKKAIGPQPQLPAAFVGKERLVIQSVKKLLLLFMLLLPINGYLVSNSNGDPINFLGLFYLPTLINQSEPLNGILSAVHMIGGWLMLLLILAHVAIVFKHWLEDEGTEKDILQRML
jgi:cytochrome b561